MWEHCLHGVERASEVDVDDVLPLVLRQLVSASPVENASVGNNGGDGTKFVNAALGKCLEGIWVTNVDMPGNDSLASRLNKTDGFSKIFGSRRLNTTCSHGTANVADDDIGALFSHTHRMRAALSASCSGDECDLASETTHNIPLTQ